MRACCLVAAMASLAFAPRASSQRLPSADSILAAHDAAVGGRAALDKHTTLRLTGTVDIPDSDLHGTVEILRGKPNWYVHRMSLTGVADVTTGYDGTTAWEISQSGPALLTDSDADDVKRLADWYFEFAVPQAIHGARVDTADFEGTPAWRLTYAATLGVEISSYFDRATGLRIGQTSSGAGDETTVVLGDYKTFGGVKVATRVVTRARGTERVITYTTVEFDKVDASAFALPPAVKALKGFVSPH
ncbi:MAG TPA: hypothetical protein VE967_08730 [Gemmatimonadaceae bacterium]|nr:hypothetical protein [Gemmatimonadaceae bacterium]